MESADIPLELVSLDETFVGYEWNAWNDFLIAHLVPNATVIPASVTQPLEVILAAIPHSAQSFLCHLDCTLTTKFPICRPQLFDALDARGIRVLNRSVSDISKRTLQAACSSLDINTAAASRSGDPEETLIVKSNLNFGGKNEKFLTPDDRALLGIRSLPTPIKGPYEYPVLYRKDIPSDWWANDSLMIETYVGNAQDLYYRCWLFLDRILLIEMHNTKDVKKMGDSRLTRHWTFNHEGEAIRNPSSANYPALLLSTLVRFRTDFQLDYGTIDVVIDDDGEPYIIDVNTTPYFNIKLPIPNLVPFLRGNSV